MSRRRVILLIESSSAYGRRCILGVSRYTRLHGHWTFWHKTQHLSDRLIVKQLAQWKADGIIARIENEPLLKVVRALKLPTVDIRGAIRIPGIPCISTDPVEVVRMALHHLQSHGYRNISFCGHRGLDFSDARQAAFMQLTEQIHGSHSIYDLDPRRSRPNIDASEKYRSPEQLALQKWLMQLPKPVGVICCSDRRGAQVIEACSAVSLRVPYDVGVVGVDNDEVICELADPPLTSVAPHVEAVGFDAARMLDAMMGGESVHETERLMAPMGVQLRASTDTTAVQDEDLSTAINFIDDHIQDGLTVGRVADEVAMSRSSIERRFQEHLGCTPREYLLRRRVDRIRQLLRETPHLKESEVAHRCGFKNTSHMIALFRKHSAQTPSQYRRGIE